MTDHVKSALENGMAMEAKKHGMRQAQDGHWTVTFTVHPEDLPADLMIAGMGTRYALTLFEVLDNEDLKLTATEPQEAADNEAKEDDRAPPEKRKWGKVRPSNQAGIICDAADFPVFVSETYPDHWADANANPARFVRNWCNIESRSQLDVPSSATDIWNDLQRAYRAWQDAPKHGAG